MLIYRSYDRSRRLFFLPRAKNELPRSLPLLSPSLLSPALLSLPSLPVLFSTSSPLSLELAPLYIARRSGGELSAPLVRSGAKPQQTHDFMHIGVKKCNSGGNIYC